MDMFIIIRKGLAYITLEPDSSKLNNVVIIRRSWVQILGAAAAINPHSLIFDYNFVGRLEMLGVRMKETFFRKHVFKNFPLIFERLSRRHVS